MNEINFEDMINTIQLGDCYELIKNIPDKSIDCIYVDIPYMIVNGGKGAGLLKSKARNQLYEKTILDYLLEILQKYKGDNK